MQDDFYYRLLKEAVRRVKRVIKMEPKVFGQFCGTIDAGIALMDV